MCPEDGWPFDSQADPALSATHNIDGTPKDPPAARKSSSTPASKPKAKPSSKPKAKATAKPRRRASKAKGAKRAVSK